MWIIAPALEPVLSLARKVLGREPVRRFLVFAPDALGDQLRAVQPDLVAAFTDLAGGQGPRALLCYSARPSARLIPKV